MSGTDWLRVALQHMQDDIEEIKADVKTLRDNQAEFRGKAIIIASVITLLINAVAIWFRA